MFRIIKRAAGHIEATLALNSVSQSCLSSKNPSWIPEVREENQEK